MAAQATIGSAMPPNCLGDCGAHNPAFLAFSWTGAIRASGMFSCSEKFCGSASSGSTFCSMKARVRCLKSSISGESVKSILTSPLDQVSQSGNCPVAERNHCRGKEFIAKGMARWNCDEAYPDFDRRGSTDFFDFARSGRLY